MSSSGYTHSGTKLKSGHCTNFGEFVVNCPIIAGTTIYLKITSASSGPSPGGGALQLFLYELNYETHKYFPINTAYTSDITWMIPIPTSYPGLSWGIVVSGSNSLEQPKEETPNSFLTPNSYPHTFVADYEIWG